jgi:hypothetical protein
MPDPRHTVRSSFSLLLAVLPSFAIAQGPAEPFAAVRARYEARMDEWRESVRAAIRSDTKQNAEEMAEQLRAFRERGDVPASASRLRGECAKLKAELLRAYDSYAKAMLATDEARGEAAVAEIAVWNRISDAVAWVAVADDDLAKARVVSRDGRATGDRDAGRMIVLPVTFEGGYRLHVSGQEDEEVGGLQLRVPKVQGFADIDVSMVEGRFSLTVTVSPEGIVIVDAGGDANGKAGQASGDDVRGSALAPALLCRSDSLRIDRVRWKPFVVVQEASSVAELRSNAKRGAAAVQVPFGRDLVVNGGNEQALRRDGSIHGWQVRSGRWHRGNPGTASHQGSGYFSASNPRSGMRTPAKAAIYQDIDLQRFAAAIDDGVVTADIAFAQQSFAQEPGDIGRVLVEFLDGAGQALPGGYDSDVLRSRGVWQRFSGSCPVPKGARTARIVLQSERPPRVKSQTSNDAHFDDVSLRLRRS